MGVGVMLNAASRAVLAALLVLAVSACGRLADSYEIKPVVISPDGTQVDANGKTVGFKPFDVTTDSLPDGSCGYKAAAASGLDASNCRNRLMDHLIMLSDQRCSAHKAAIEANAAGANFAFSSVTTLLGGAGAIVTGADAARALAGSAGIVSGVQSNWNESIYQKNVASAIVAKIDENRQSIYDKMITARNNPSLTYSVDAMLADVYRYHDACSFYSGVMNLGKTATAPLTADALRGRIASIRSQMTENKTLMDSNPDLANSLEAVNRSLAKTLQFLSIQLGVVETRSGVVPTSAASSPSGASATTQ